MGAVVAVRAAARDHRFAEGLVLARGRLPDPQVVMLLTTATLLPVLPEAFLVASLAEVLTVTVRVVVLAARPNVRLVGQVAKDLAGPPVNVSIFQNSSARLS